MIRHPNVSPVPLLALATLLGLATVARAQDAGSIVTFPNGEAEVCGYLAQPEGDGPFPAVLVIHEWYGLSDWVKSCADRLADQGYLALAVDLYDGRLAQDAGEAHELMRALDPQEGVAKLQAGAEFLKTRPVSNAEDLGVIGWCMGGMYSRLISQASEAIGPTVICYGSIVSDPEQIAPMKSKPVLGIFGAEDRGIPTADVRDYFQMLGSDGEMADVYIYDDAGHAFMRPGGRSYVEGSANDAWNRIESFFAKYLQKQSGSESDKVVVPPRRSRRPASA